MNGAGCRTYRFCRVSWSMAHNFSPARMTSTATFAVGRKNTPRRPMWSRSRFLLGDRRGRECGSDYLFRPGCNIDTVKTAVASLQSRLQFGAIFVSDRYGEVAGTLPMSLIKTGGTAATAGRRYHRPASASMKTWLWQGNPASAMPARSTAEVITAASRDRHAHFIVGTRARL